MNEDKFSGKGKIYSKFRPKYAVNFINFLYDEIGFKKDSVIADIGSGTGIFTSQLLEKGSTVFAVEPNEDMQKIAEENLSKFENFVSINAGAENTGLKEASVDFITAAQAFHWFDVEKFRKEADRILKPSGKIVLVWNSRDTDSKITKENEKIDIEFCKNFVGFSGGISGPLKKDNIDLFFNGKYEIKEFDNSLIFDKEAFIGRNLSSSYAPKENEENYGEYINALSDLFDKFSEDGKIIYPFITKAYVGK